MMMRSFSQGENSLPQANGLQRGQYTVKAHLKTGETTSVPYAVYEIDEWDDTNKYFVVKRPTSDSIPHAQLLIGPGHAVPADKTFMASQATEATTASADTGQTVAVGDDIGTQTDSYKLKVDNTGFKALRYESTEGRCLVRPFSSGGGGLVYTNLECTVSGFDTGYVAYGGSVQEYTSWVSLPEEIADGTKVYGLFAGVGTYYSAWRLNDGAEHTVPNLGAKLYVQLGDSSESVLYSFLVSSVSSSGNSLGSGGVLELSAQSTPVQGYSIASLRGSLSNEYITISGDVAKIRHRVEFVLPYPVSPGYDPSDTSRRVYYSGSSAGVAYIHE